MFLFYSFDSIDPIHVVNRKQFVNTLEFLSFLYLNATKFLGSHGLAIEELVVTQVKRSQDQDLGPGYYVHNMTFTYSGKTSNVQTTRIFTVECKRLKTPGYVEG